MGNDGREKGRLFKLALKFGTVAGAAANQVTQAVASDACVKVTATFDYLSGQHPGPGGQDMYWYNSLLVFEPGSSTSSTAKRAS